MKSYFFIFLLFFFVSPSIWAQTYQVKVHYKDGQIVNVGSSDIIQRISTGYDHTTMSPSVWITERSYDKNSKKWGYVGTMALGSDQDIDSISFIPKEESKTIYQYLEDAGVYTYTLRLLNELGYAIRLREDVENSTLFVADDNQWCLFFASTKSPVKNYEELSKSQKMALLKLFAYSNSESRFSAVSSEYNELQGGKAFRKADLLNFNDTSYISASELPKNSYWDAIRQQGGAFLSHLPLDTSLSIVFTKKTFENLSIKDDDIISLLDDSYEPDAKIYFFDTPVLSEIQCRNGYIYKLSELTFTPQTLDEELRKIKDCSLFSSLLDRFTIPVKFGEKEGEAVYRKGYFASEGTYALQKDPKGDYQPLLLYDPAWRNGNCVKNTFPQEDMGVMFVPTNEALEKWWDSPVRRLAMNGYTNWEEVPNMLLSELINNHMKTSFLKAFPSKFDEILNTNGYKQNIKKEDIVGKYMANNGLIYIVNKVYTPDSYIPVWAPCLKVDDCKVMRFALLNTDKTTYIPDGYTTYLSSRENCFSLLLPTDDALMNYVDPFYVSEDGSTRKISFSYRASSVQATAIILDKEGIPVGNSTTVSIDKMLSLLKDILNNSVIAMEQKDWSKGGYYKTIGGAFLNISAFGEGATVLSGGNVERNEKPIVSKVYNQSSFSLNGDPGTGGNGVVMVVDIPMQPTLKSVIHVLNEHPEFREFASLLAGKDDQLAQEYNTRPDSLKQYQPLILSKAGTAAAAPITSRSENVGFLGNYNYTLYVPTNEAMQEAYDQGLPKWKDMESLPKPDKDGNWESEDKKRESLVARKAIARKIMDFIRFHFQYTSICTDVNTHERYKTHAFRSVEKTPYELDVQCSSGALEICSLSSSDSKAKTRPSLCNIMAREYQFDKGIATATKIINSPYIVVHGIDAPLFFSKKGTNGNREQFK